MKDFELFCTVQQAMLEQLPVYLIEYRDLFLRSHLYSDIAGNLHPDNRERFGFFAKLLLNSV